MKQVPYSPFNRTYKYLCLQNQLAHNRNKKSVKGLVDSNLIVLPDPDSIINLSTTYRSSNKNNNKDKNTTWNKSMMSTRSKSMTSSMYGKLK
jgi:hypothetical protein